MKDLGPAQLILGIRIRREGRRITLDQSTYIKNFLREYQMDNANSVSTPWTETKCSHHHRRTSSKPIGIPKEDWQHYVRYGKYTTGSCVRCGKAQSVYTRPRCETSNRSRPVLKYLKGTADFALVYDHNEDGNPISYADAAYGDNLSDRKSTYDHTLLLGNGAVIWASKSSTRWSPLQWKWSSLPCAKQVRTLCGLHGG